MERTLNNLRKNTRGDVYVFLRNAEIGEQFLRNAEAEGFTLGGEKPTAKPYAEVMALHDGTVSYVGANGMIRFGCGDTAVFHRVDYEKYMSGAEDYGYRKAADQKGEWP